MHNIKQFCDFICDFKKTAVSIDVCHNMLLFGAVMSHKPDRILELGIGDGYTTMSLLYGIKFNGKGSLVSIDNYSYRNQAALDMLKKAGANIVAPVGEEEFVKSQADDAYDFLVSDADHNNSGKWTDDIFRIVRNDGVIFVHDIFYNPSVTMYLKECQRLNKPYFLFNSSSRKDEECELGWLMIKNTKV